MKTIILRRAIRIRDECITIYIPKGFKTDGASIPTIFWWFGKPFDKDTLIPSFCHDMLYKTHIPKIASDIIFLHLMKHEKVKFIKRWIYFIVVLLLGRKRR